MPCPRTSLFVTACLAAACASNPDRHTLAELHDVEPDLSEVRVEDGLAQAMLAYRDFLAEAPESSLTPEAMRRLADLKLEREFGILGDGELVALPAPQAPAARDDTVGVRTDSPRAASIADHSESERDFERRAAGQVGMTAASGPEPELPGGRDPAVSGPLEAIGLYDQILTTYPNYPHNDRVLYQKARAFDELGRTDEAIAVIERLVAEYPHSHFVDEVQFRRAEYFFTRRKFLNAEEAYGAITAIGPASEYYELALYKLGWTLYKQELHEEAIEQYIALLDYKVSIGYDFDQPTDESDERRIADTYRVISLGFSNLGGPEAVAQYFAAAGVRSYEDRIYSHLGEFYLEKLRYQDAAATYEAFVDLHPLHRASPHFGMRVVEIYETGGFPILVLEAKKEFAASYGLQSEYWRTFDVAEAPEVLDYLRSNLEDLASHYHALYQEEELAEDAPANFLEAGRWYRAYLASFPADTETPVIHHRFADLLLEHGDFGEAAREYEQTAYGYPAHERAAAAGYAAIYAHRQHQERARGEEREAVRREAVASTLRFVDAFPAHEHAATVLGRAVDDLYEMQEFEQAIATGQRLIDGYPQADVGIRRSAWTVVAHASFDTARYPEAEHAYARVLELTPADDESRPAVAENLAASIYKQGEEASVAADDRAAADHFLRIVEAAPDSDIRPNAEYDAAAALIRLEDWAGAAQVLEAFRESHPKHELHEEATKQIASVYRKQGEISRAAEEYERVAAEANDPELGREALLLAGELYEDSQVTDQALAVYLRYVEQFPEPVEMAVEMRFKLAGMYEAKQDEVSRHAQLRRIVESEAAAGDARTPRVRYLAAQSALVLSEGFFARFDEVELVQPFEQSLQEKQRRMDAALDAFGRLVDYEVAEVTAAATFYMAEIYFDFSQALLASERPTDLAPAELQDYELVLEEESFPFEERAIAVHEKNLELLGTGLYNAWIEKSLGRLAILMPGRYAKFEASSGFLTSIDHYAYRAPNAPTPGADDELEVPQQVEIVEASSAPREVGIETEAADAPASLADDAGSEEPAQPEPDLASESPVDEAPERSPGMEVDDASRD
jgi:tetratricopeptide (TPR) repeat protein